ncbi:MAG: hypothetical protein WCA30_11205 [Dermatophilaceae bacterium]
MQTLTSLTWFNKIGLVVLTGGIAYLVVRGEYVGAAIWAVALAYLAFSVRRSVTARADDRERVAAAQPYDERDAAAIRSAFSVVGQVAFLGQVAIVIWYMGQPIDERILIESVKVVVLAVVLGLANRSALQRV